MDIPTTLACRYARAFLNVFGSVLTPRDIACCRSIVEFLENNTSALMVLNFPVVHQEKKEQLLLEVFASCSEQSSWRSLISLLMRDHRLFLLIPILNHIQKFYATQTGIEECTISSAQPLLQEQLHAILKFIEQKRGKKIIYTHLIDPTLIAGIAIKGDNFVWEHSVRRQLERLKEPLILEGIL